MSKLKRICPVCHSTFVPNPATQKYCSTACSDKASYELTKARLKNTPLPLLNTCVYCGVLFNPKYSNTRFCSKKCYDKWRRRGKKSIPDESSEPKKPLSDWIREAKECNLDYGTYRALINAGKSFDELKSQANSRSPRVHNRSHKIIGGAL